MEISRLWATSSLFEMNNDVPCAEQQCFHSLVQQQNHTRQEFYKWKKSEIIIFELSLIHGGFLYNCDVSRFSINYETILLKQLFEDVQEERTMYVCIHYPIGT